MRVFRHDFKNNLTSVRALISDGQYGEAKKYIDELYGRLDATKSAFSTGNHFADAILAEKSAAAAIWQTKLDFDGIIPADGIENIDLCTILANALDNAVEASKLVGNAVISVHAVQDSAVFMLTVSNPGRDKEQHCQNDEARQREPRVRHRQHKKRRKEIQRRGQSQI